MLLISDVVNSCLKDLDSELFAAIENEFQRQQNQIELIASENFVSRNVLSAIGSILTNKYAEGYPGKRYYGGCKFVDDVEQLAINRLCQLFKVNFANVQPHSGSQANFAVMFALLNPGDTFMGMELSAGGHLTHGAPPTVSGKWFNPIHYSVDKNGFIDYEEVLALARKHKPKMIIAGASSYSRIIDFEKFRNICDSVGAYLMVDMAHYAGLIAASLYPSPVECAHVITGTTHKTLRGPRGGFVITNNQEIAKKIDSAVFPGTQGGPHMHIIAAKAVAFYEALRPEFQEYCKHVVRNAKALADCLIDNGFKIVSGGTDCHMLTVDLTSINVTGLQAEEALERFGITCNKNSIPYDPLPYSKTSGIRLGTAAMTTRGFVEEEFIAVGKLISDVLKNIDDLEKISASVSQDVAKMCKEFPLYG